MDCSVSVGKYNLFVWTLKVMNWNKVLLICVSVSVSIADVLLQGQPMQLIIFD